MFFLIVRAYLYIRKKNQREKRNLSKVCSKISDVEMQNFFDEVDGEEITKDANGQYWFGERPFKFHVEFVQPSLYRVILTWAFIELCMMSYVLLRFKEGYPENFLNGFCSAYRCKSYMPKFMSYKIFSAVLLAIGGQKKLFFVMIPWLVINVFGFLPLQSVVIASIVPHEHISDNVGELIAWYDRLFN